MRLVSVNIGSTRDVGGSGRASVKTPATGRVDVLPLGLAGDLRADPSGSGGHAQAVYAYPSEHLPFWQTVRAQARVAPWDHPINPGTLGENLTLSGLLEGQVWVGDLLRFPRCSLSVSAPGRLCDEFNVAIGFPQAGKLMAQAGFCGFYLAVREPGSIEAGEDFELIPGPREVSIPELFRSQMAKQRKR